MKAGGICGRMFLLNQNFCRPQITIAFLEPFVGLLTPKINFVHGACGTRFTPTTSFFGGIRRSPTALKAVFIPGFKSRGILRRRINHLALPENRRDKRALE